MDPSSTKINCLKKSLMIAYRDEESFWKQIRKDDWILYGDLSVSCSC